MSSRHMAIGVAFALLALLALAGAAAPDRPATSAVPETAPSSSFGFVDIYIDTGREPLAAWQFELKVGNASIVGIERGDAAGFTDPPYYDPAALSQRRIVVGAFNTAADLPAGKTRVARLHLHIEGNAGSDCQVRVIVAGSREGNPIPATATFVEGETR